MDNIVLSGEARALIEQGKNVSAIKLVKEENGCTLVEAHSVVTTYRRGVEGPGSTRTSPFQTDRLFFLSDTEVELLQLLARMHDDGTLANAFGIDPDFHDGPENADPLEVLLRQWAREGRRVLRSVGVGIANCTVAKEVGS